MRSVLEAPQGLAVGPAGSGGPGLVAVAGRQARKSSPSAPPPREKLRPARKKTPILGHFSYAGRTFSRSHPPPDHAGRTFSRTGQTEVVTVKPTTPLQPLIQASVKPPSPMLTPEQHPLKPTTPMQPKNAPKTPNSHPQRRYRFQLRLGRRPQRRCRFQAHTGTHEQRQQRFQTSGPPGRQGLAAAPVGSGGTWPGNQWTADVTNVVKPTQFKSPHEDPCYKRRQSEAKNHYFSQKCRRIDDVCNKRRKNRTISSSD